MILQVIHGETVPPATVKRYHFQPILDGETVPLLIVKIIGSFVVGARSLWKTLRVSAQDKRGPTTAPVNFPSKTKAKKNLP